MHQECKWKGGSSFARECVQTSDNAKLVVGDQAIDKKRHHEFVKEIRRSAFEKKREFVLLLQFFRNFEHLHLQLLRIGRHFPALEKHLKSSRRALLRLGVLARLARSTTVVRTKKQNEVHQTESTSPSSFVPSLDTDHIPRSTWYTRLQSPAKRRLVDSKRYPFKPEPLNKPERRTRAQNRVQFFRSHTVCLGQ